MIAAYEDEIVNYRSLAVKSWNDHLRSATVFNRELPTFFLDQFSFRAFLKDLCKAPELRIIDWPKFCDLEMTWDISVRNSVCGVPEIGLHAPDLDAPIIISDFLKSLQERWVCHLAAYGISRCVATEGLLIRGTSLRSLHKRSVFYPKLPVLWGPNYYKRLSSLDKAEILKNGGKQGVWDFYIFLLQCHEFSHGIQKGEPLLGEFSHAVVWNQFLTKESLWRYQRNSSTGKSSNVETPYVHDLETHSHFWGQMYSDSFLAIRNTFGISGLYTLLVGLGYCVHEGLVSYRAYLRCVSNIIRTIQKGKKISDIKPSILLLQSVITAHLSREAGYKVELDQLRLILERFRVSWNSRSF